MAEIEGYNLPDELFYRRMHAGAASAQGIGAKLAWLSPERGGRSFPVLRRMLAHLEAIQRAPITPSERRRAHVQYLCAHAQARYRHRRWQVSDALRGAARTTLRPLRRRQVV